MGITPEQYARLQNERIEEYHKTPNPYRISWQDEMESAKAIGWKEGYAARMQDELESLKHR